MTDFMEWAFKIWYIFKIKRSTETTEHLTRRFLLRATWPKDKAATTRFSRSVIVKKRQRSLRFRWSRAHLFPEGSSAEKKEKEEWGFLVNNFTTIKF